MNKYKYNVIGIIMMMMIGIGSSLYPKESKVESLTSANFNKRVLESPMVSIVEFYAPWCGHCKQFAPEYLKAAGNLDGLVQVFAVDGDQHKELSGKYGVKGFPTIVVFGVDKKPVPYEGARTAADLVKFATNMLPSKYVSTLRLSAELDSVMVKMEVPRAVLFTDKPATPALGKALSLRFRSKDHKTSYLDFY